MEWVTKVPGKDRAVPSPAVAAITSRVLGEPAEPPAAPAPAPAAGVARCCHGAAATEPCPDCGRRFVAGELVGGFIGGATRG